MIRTVLLPLVALVAVAVGGLSVSLGLASAQVSPALSAVATDAADTYIVSGSGFEPGAELWVNEISCGELPCGAGLQPGSQRVTVGSDGTFEVEMALAPDDKGRGYRLIAAYGEDWTQEQIDQAPTIRVPEYSPGTTAPAPPSVGTGVGADTQGVPVWPLAGAALLLSAALAVTAHRTRATQTKN